MTPKEIILKYPEVFGEPPFDIRTTLIPFGFECSKYWYPVLEKGFADISEIIKRDGIEGFHITQVKEKFGGLRVYCNFYTDEIDKVINRMEEEVSHICEECGSTEGHLITRGWMQTLCPVCYEKKYNEPWEDKPEEEVDW